MLSSRNNVVGSPSGDVTLVEFFDYNCGYCKRALGDLKALMQADPKLRACSRTL
jgi:protein-disulfide isomerase